MRPSSAFSCRIPPTKEGVEKKWCDRVCLPFSAVTPYVTHGPDCFGFPTYGGEGLSNWFCLKGSPYWLPFARIILPTCGEP